MTDIDKDALDSLSVAPDTDGKDPPRSKSEEDKQLDKELDDTMDGSDPPSSTQP